MNMGGEDELPRHGILRVLMFADLGDFLPSLVQQKIKGVCIHLKYL